MREYAQPLDYPADPTAKDAALGAGPWRSQGAYSRIKRGDRPARSPLGYKKSPASRGLLLSFYQFALARSIPIFWCLYSLLAKGLIPPRGDISCGASSGQTAQDDAVNQLGIRSRRTLGALLAHAIRCLPESIRPRFPYAYRTSRPACIRSRVPTTRERPSQARSRYSDK